MPPETALEFSTDGAVPLKRQESAWTLGVVLAKFIIKFLKKNLFFGNIFRINSLKPIRAFQMVVAQGSATPWRPKEYPRGEEWACFWRRT